MIYEQYCFKSYASIFLQLFNVSFKFLFLSINYHFFHYTDHVDFYTFIICNIVEQKKAKLIKIKYIN